MIGYFSCRTNYNLFIFHGRKLLFWKRLGKSRVMGVLKGIFIPDLYQNFRIWGCDMVNGIKMQTYVAKICSKKD